MGDTSASAIGIDARGAQENPPTDQTRSFSALESQRPLLIKSLAVSAEEYAGRVLSHSRLSATSSLFSGVHYRALGTYLNHAYHIPTTSIRAPNERPIPGSESQNSFIIHSFDKNGRRHPVHGAAAETIKGMDSLANPGPIVGTLIFLMGYQTPGVLNEIGARYNIDPELFRRHMDFDYTSGRNRQFPYPTLPSASGDMVHLLSTTVGCRAPYNDQITVDMDDNVRLRNRITQLMEEYRTVLCLGNNAHLSQGRSIVRDVALHDAQHFSIEQDISMYIGTAPTGWVALVWTDVGSDLGRDKDCAWHPSTLQYGSHTVEYLPVPQHKSGIALDAKNQASARRPDNGENTTVQIPQSASLLHIDYGQSLDAKNMAADPFYALTEVFQFVAFSEVQLLNLLESKLTRELNPVLLSQKNLDLMPTLRTFVYNKQVLDRHIGRLNGALEFLEAKSSKASPHQVAIDARTTLMADYQYLKRRADSIAGRFDIGMGNLMNKAMIQESQKAISQAEGVAQLTGLAFFFIPLSLTASIFGMNARQFVPGAPISIWVWVITSVGTLLVAYLFLSWQAWKLKERVQKLTPTALFREFNASSKTEKTASPA